MTIAADFANARPQAIEPARMADGGRMIARGAQRLVGVSLTLAALGLWLAPGSSWESDVMLFKLILSLTAIIAGLGLISQGASPRAPEVEVDTIRREVRLVRRQRGMEDQVLQSSSFADLAHAEHEGTNVRLWDPAGRFLAEVSLTDRNALTSLVAGLRDAGKLA